MTVLIIGGGVAGLSLAHQLEHRGVDFKILTERENHSTKVAAGMINPLVFRRMLKSWETDKLLPYLNDFYQKLESKTKSSYFHHMPIRRLFSSEDEAKLWKERSKAPEYAQYINLDAEPYPEYAKNEFGQGFVLMGGFIRSEKFLEENRRYFEEKNQLIYTSINYKDINLKDQTVQGIAFDKLIFAEGFKGKNNPYFDYLPIGQTKGEILDIKSTQLSEDEILNRKCFVLPVGENSFKLGATFDWNTTDLTPTEESKRELQEKFENISSANYTIIDHKVGIRPTSIDRRPLIGEHPKIKNIYIFNGLGTKGYMLAPYFSEHMIKHILDKTELLSDVNIQRFHKRFRKQEAGEL